MKIHVVQRDGTRYFSRFSEISERDRLVVELRIEDKNGSTITIDLTEALIREYSRHPEIGGVSATGPAPDVISLQPIKPLKPKRAKAVSPVDQVDTRKADILSKVREAQAKAVEEKNRKRAEQAAARAARLAAAREGKAAKRKSSDDVPSGPASKTKSQKSKGRSASVSGKAKSAQDPKGKRRGPEADARSAARPGKAEAAGLTAAQESAIKKVGEALSRVTNSLGAGSPAARQRMGPARSRRAKS
ncbi:MAG: hypothetical protein ACP5R5_02110 [Armatimonadota bacterium]